MQKQIVKLIKKSDLVSLIKLERKKQEIYNSVNSYFYILDEGAPIVYIKTPLKDFLRVQVSEVFSFMLANDSLSTHFSAGLLDIKVEEISVNKYSKAKEIAQQVIKIIDYLNNEQDAFVFVWGEE